MDATVASKIIEAAHFMPGWRFECLVMAPTLAAVSVSWATYNSDQDKALTGYPHQVALERRMIVETDRYDTDDELHAMLVTWLIEIQIHETREFFRVGPDMRAPFHPHRPEAQAAWGEHVATATADPMRGTFLVDPL